MTHIGKSFFFRKMCTQIKIFHLIVPSMDATGVRVGMWRVLVVVGIVEWDGYLLNCRFSVLWVVACW